jgi:hypothetical protein
MENPNIGAFICSEPFVDRLSDGGRSVIILGYLKDLV